MYLSLAFNLYYDFFLVDEDIEPAKLSYRSLLRSSRAQFEENPF